MKPFPGFPRLALLEILLLGMVLACSLRVSYSGAGSMAQPVPVTQVLLVTQKVSIVQTVPVTQIIEVTRVVSPERSTAVKMEVFANQGWQNSKVGVSPDDTVTVRYVSGKWTGGIGRGNWYDGRGDLIAKYKCVENYEPNLCDEPMPGVFNGTLVGKIGRSIFEIGNFLQFYPREKGDLYLRMNDHDEGLFDNEGSLIVEIVNNNG
ncbi:MAG: hypothetical protein WBM17_08955 [Anaerolineales bacterium]